MLPSFRMKDRGLRGDTVPQMSAPAAPPEAAPEPDGDEVMPELGAAPEASSPGDEIKAQFGMLAPEDKQALLQELTAMCADDAQQASPDGEGAILE